MNYWNKRTFPQNDEHQRSASIAGYNDIMNGDYNHLLWNGNKFSNQYHASVMDLNKMTNSSLDHKHQFPWRNSTITSEPLQSYPLNSNSNGGENAFKTAISKMKESSIYRLGTMENKIIPNSTGQSLVQQSPENYYYRNCMTLPLKKTMVEARLPKSSHKIFKCNSTAEHGRDEILSTNLPFIDCGSETESDKNYKDNQYRSVSNLYSDHTQWQENSMSKKFINPIKKSHLSNGIKNHSSSNIVIPAHKYNESMNEKERKAEVTEQYICPVLLSKPQSALPKYEQYKINKSGYESDSLSSINDSNLKEDAWTNDNAIMTKSLIITSDKPPLKKLQRNGSQKILDGYSSTCQGEQFITPLNKMSGLYKKSSPPSPKGKQTNNMPMDFQKLHSAFLDQKNEIKHLKHELEEKKLYIIQLESEIRSYEPWR